MMTRFLDNRPNLFACRPATAMIGIASRVWSNMYPHEVVRSDAVTSAGIRSVQLQCSLYLRQYHKNHASPANGGTNCSQNTFLPPNRVRTAPAIPGINTRGKGLLAS